MSKSASSKRGIAECLNGRAALAAAKGQRDEGETLARLAREQFTALCAGMWSADRHGMNRIFEWEDLRRHI